MPRARVLLVQTCCLLVLLPLLLLQGVANLSRVQERRAQWTIEHLQNRRKDRLQYIKLYRKRLTTLQVSARVCCRPTECTIALDIDRGHVHLTM
jgi:hypothetical protein